MSSAKITLIGMYNYDNTLFDLLSLPEDINKQTLVDNILLRSGEFEVLYPDMDFLKYSIGAWSRKWQRTFDRCRTALNLEYNPLENYDRQETWTDNRTLAGTASGQTSAIETGSSSGSESGSSSGTTSGTTGSITTNKVSAYDSGNNLTTKDQTEINGSDSTSNSGQSSTQTTGQSSTQTSGSHSDTHNASDDLAHSGRVHGNIGVTTSQMMLTSELQLGYWNIYEKITDIFLTEFVLPIY